MTPDIHVVRPDDPIARLRELMSEKHIRHVPVRRVSGLDSEVPLSVSDDVSAAMKVNEVMIWHVETVEADEDAATAAAVMLENKYGCLSVLEQGHLWGF
jgi:predicted transcriptional regulator